MVVLRGGNLVKYFSETPKTLSLHETSSVYNTRFAVSKESISYKKELATSSNKKPSSTLDIDNAKILWAPLQGLEFSSGTKAISPATALGHEMGHAFNAYTNPKAQFVRRAEFNPVFTDDEEKFVMMNFEIPIATDFNEGIRSTHYQGTARNTVSSTSTEKPAADLDYLTNQQEVILD